MATDSIGSIPGVSFWNEQIILFMAAAVAIAQAVGAISNTVTSFVNAGAQRLGLAKGLENDIIRFEMEKDLYNYSSAIQNRRIAMYLVFALAVIVLVVKFRK